MNREPVTPEAIENEGRRGFIKMLGAGLMITVAGDEALAQQQRGGRRGQGGKGGKSGGRGGSGGSQLVSARLHIGEDGAITVLTGKVEEGQGARGEITQAAAEELRVSPEKVAVVMADFPAVPNDGTTAGSMTTPRTIPPVRQACAAARKMLVELACARWSLQPEAAQVQDGVITDKAGNRTLTYGELAKTQEAADAFKRAIPSDVTVTPVKEWKVLGTSFLRPNIKDLFLGAHKFPSDIIRPGMLYGKVLRAPSYGATLTSIDLAPARAMKDVIVVRAGDFVGCAAPTSYRAQQAVEAIAKTAQWKTVEHVSSKDLFTHLKAKASGGLSKAAPSAAGKTLTASYNIAYIQHTPLEPRTATAEWAGDRLTVWTGSSNPASVHSELARQFNMPADKVRLIVPDMGGGYGGKHTGEAALEAARLAKAAGKPVNLRWTRAEEFTWAYFRPAGVIETRGTLDAKGTLAEWEMININSGGAAVASPYKIPKNNSRTVGSDAPLRQSSYRALASTANNFARESSMDELAAAAGADPYDFRMAHLEDPRLRSVLEAATKKFGWAARKGKGSGKDTGIGLACGTEKNSVVAACVEVAIDRAAGKIKVLHVVEAFECGTVLNPANMQLQVEGCIIMGLGGALSEAIEFEGGKILNASLGQYQVPRFKDIPKIDVILMNWPEMNAVGGGETPIIAIAPAIANAVFNATGLRIRSMPIRLPEEKKA